MKHNLTLLISQFIVLLVAFPIIASAECPNPFSYKGVEHCAYLAWENTENKIKGQFEDTHEKSPYLISMGEAPQKWHYSKAQIFIYEKKDPTKTLIQIPDFKIFPYMFMKGGHHHGTSHSFSLNPETGSYVLERVTFQKMMGCWSLRWTTDKPNQLENSNPLAFIINFSNQSDEDNEVAKKNCQDHQSQ